MSVETQLVAALKLLCPRVYADTAPTTTVRPYVIWQRVGGQTVRYQDNTAADQRNAMVQINTWCSTRLEADALARQIEDALCASAVLIAEPQSEPTALNEPDLGLYGNMQDFSLWGDR